MSHFYVPSNLVIEDHLSPELLRYKYEALYLIHRIVVGRNRYRDDNRGYVSLKIEYLRRVIPGRVLPKLIRHLITAEVIECDGWYIKGRKARGYRLSSKFRNVKTQRIRCEKVKLTRKIRCLSERGRAAISLDIHKYLLRWLQHLEIDVDEAVWIVEQANISDERKTIIRHSIDRIFEQEWNFSFDPFGRVHTNLTNLSSLVRSTLHLGGNNLVEIDIANSQPLFLALLVLHFRSNKDKTLDYKTFKNENNFDILSPSPYLRITQCNVLQEITGYEFTSIRQKLAKDEQKYLALCEEGRLYEYLQEMLGIERMSRKEFKRQFFQVLFGANSYHTEFRQLFRELFPQLSKVIHRHKRRKPQYLAQLMQWYESNFVIGTVCRRLMENHPEFPVLTIHDSILTTAPHAETVKSIIEQEFSNLGLFPTLKIKKYGLATRDKMSA